MAGNGAELSKSLYWGILSVTVAISMGVAGVLANEVQEHSKKISTLEARLYEMSRRLERIEDKQDRMLEIMGRGGR